MPRWVAGERGWIAGQGWLQSRSDAARQRRRDLPRSPSQPRFLLAFFAVTATSPHPPTTATPASWSDRSIAPGRPRLLRPPMNSSQDRKGVTDSTSLPRLVYKTISRKVAIQGEAGRNDGRVGEREQKRAGTSCHLSTQMRR